MSNPRPHSDADPPPPALVVGEALTDVLVRPDGQRSALPGGSPANVALGLGRLGHPVRFATRIGTDHRGGLLHGHLRKSGVLLTPGSVVDGSTSTATAVLDASGAAVYSFDIVWELSARAAEAVRGGPPTHLHTGSIATAMAPGADTVLAAVEAAGASATVSYDPNLRPALLGPPGREQERVERLVAASDVVKASNEDLAWLHPGVAPGATAARWAAAGPALVVVTSGAGGAQVWWRRGCLSVPAEPVRVVDTVGAGDAFTAALVGALLEAGLLGGAPSFRAALRAATGGAQLPAAVARALARASLAAALTCARRGADLPTRADLTGPFPYR